MNQNRRCMRRFSAFLGVIAMLCALLTAPLFHVHDQDDHGHATSFVHAHFVEHSEGEHHHSQTHDAPDYESSDSRHGRAIDVFTLSLPLPGFDLIVDRETRLPLPVQFVRAGVVMLATPRAHGPPATRRSAPRSPPTA
jgi:hypothetical protein